MCNFSVQKGYKDREASAIILKAPEMGLSYRILSEPLPETVPVGSVEYCRPIENFPVDFFPDGLRQYLTRWHDFDNGGCFLEGSYFVKDLSYWKTPFETKQYPDGQYLEDGNWFISEPIEMINEWRYYVVNGDVITTGWYRGQDEDKPAPKIEFPEDYCGAADFAETPNGPELIECHAPFACGWYGEDHEDYVYWQFYAWHLAKKNIELQGEEE